MDVLARNVEVYDQDENYLPVVSAIGKPSGGIVVTVEVEAAPSTDHQGAVELRDAAEALILSRKGWERWGEGNFLYDRHKGVGTGTVYSTADALRKLRRGSSDGS